MGIHEIWFGRKEERKKISMYLNDINTIDKKKIRCEVKMGIYIIIQKSPPLLFFCPNWTDNYRTGPT